MDFICSKSSHYAQVDAIYIFNTLSLANEPVLFSLHGQSLDSDPGLLYEHALVFRAGEHRALCVTA